MFARPLGSLPRPRVISGSAQRRPLASYSNRTLAGGSACDADTVYAVHAGAAYLADLARRASDQPVDRDERAAFVTALSDRFDSRSSVSNGEFYRMLGDLQKAHHAYPRKRSRV